MDANQSVEFTGEDVEAAIAVGLAELGVGPGDVLVEVVDEPSRGVFGIGARPARVRLKLLRPITPKTQPEPAPVAQVADYEEFDQDEDDAVFIPSGASDDEDAEGEDGAVGKEVLSELLKYMGIKGQVVVRHTDPSRPGESAPWLLDINGPDMSLLIGRRGETLSALQYVTRLITSRKLQRRANIIVDAGGYKSRRSQRLRQLALRMADQAVQQARTVSLEPMPPNERRIIHLALRGRSDVITRSTGEGSSRKVTIVPK